MATTKKLRRLKRKKKLAKKKYFGTIDPNMKNFGNDPYFVKKAEEAKAFLKRAGVPKGKAPLEDL